MFRTCKLENVDVAYILKTRGNPYIGPEEIELVSTHLNQFVDSYF